jgi:hypothetical protein
VAPLSRLICIKFNSIPKVSSPPWGRVKRPIHATSLFEGRNHATVTTTRNQKPDNQRQVLVTSGLACPEYDRHSVQESRRHIGVCPPKRARRTVSEPLMQSTKAGSYLPGSMKSEKRPGINPAAGTARACITMVFLDGCNRRRYDWRGISSLH